MNVTYFNFSGQIQLREYLRELKTVPSVGDEVKIDADYFLGLPEGFKREWFGELIFVVAGREQRLLGREYWQIKLQLFNPEVLSGYLQLLTMQ